MTTDTWTTPPATIISPLGVYVADIPELHHEPFRLMATFTQARDESIGCEIRAQIIFDGWQQIIESISCYVRRGTMEFYFRPVQMSAQPIGIRFVVRHGDQWDVVSCSE